MQDELAKFDALKGQIYTSPGLAQRRPGSRNRNDLLSFFPIRSGALRQTELEKKRGWVWGGLYPGRRLRLRSAAAGLALG